jgi:hypothetical protein
MKIGKAVIGMGLTEILKTVVFSQSFDKGLY